MRRVRDDDRSRPADARGADQLRRSSIAIDNADLPDACARDHGWHIGMHAGDSNPTGLTAVERMVDFQQRIHLFREENL